MLFLLDQTRTKELEKYEGYIEQEKKHTKAKPQNGVLKDKNKIKVTLLAQLRTCPTLYSLFLFRCCLSFFICYCENYLDGAGARKKSIKERSILVAV